MKYAFLWCQTPITIKYIERNPVRAKLCSKPTAWKWGSAFRRLHGDTRQRALLAELPVDLPKNYSMWINQPEPSEEDETIRYSINKGVPYGNVTLPKNIRQ